MEGQMLYVYGSRSRGGYLSGLPADGLVSMEGYAESRDGYKTVIIYSRPLTHAEEESHSLTLLGISRECKRPWFSATPSVAL